MFLHHISAHIHRHAVGLAGKLAQRRILGRDGQIGIGATDQTTGIPPKNQSSRRHEQILYPTGYSFGYGFCTRLRLQFFLRNVMRTFCDETIGRVT